MGFNPKTKKNVYMLKAKHDKCGTMCYQITSKDKAEGYTKCKK